MVPLSWVSLQPVPQLGEAVSEETYWSATQEYYDEAMRMEDIETVINEVREGEPIGFVLNFGEDVEVKSYWFVVVAMK